MLPRRTLPLSPGSFVIILLHLSLTFGTTALHYLNPQADKYFIPGGAGMAAIVCIGLIADSLEELRWRREVSDQESSVRDMVI